MAKSAATKQPAASKRPAAKRAPATQAAAARPRVTRMHDVPNIVTEEELDQLPDQPFAGGSVDSLDPDLRHRLVSDAAYQRYVDRGYADGYDFDDWLQAEAAIDHLLLNRTPEWARRASDSEPRPEGRVAERLSTADTMSCGFGKRCKEAVE